MSPSKKEVDKEIEKIADDYRCLEKEIHKKKDELENLKKKAIEKTKEAYPILYSKTKHCKDKNSGTYQTGYSTSIGHENDTVVRNPTDNEYEEALFREYNFGKEAEDEIYWRNYQDLE